MRGKQIPLGGRVAARPVRSRPSGPDPLAAHGWREVRAAAAQHRPTHRTRMSRPPVRPPTTRNQKRSTAAGRRVRLALAALLLLGLTGLATWLTTTPALRVRQVRVQGTADAALIASVRALSLTGCFVLLCDTRSAAARAETLPRVASAKAWLDPPSTLVVRVTPRQPVLVWRTGGSAVLVGGDGVVIGPASAPDLAQMPIVDDPAAAALPGGKAAPGTKLPAQLVELAAQLRSGLPALLGGSMSLSYDATLGLVADNGSGVRVVFGDPSRMPAGVSPSATSQLAELRAILGALSRAGQHASWIDLRWEAHPAYRLG